MKRLFAIALIAPAAVNAQRAHPATATYDRVRDTTTVEAERLCYGAPIYMGAGEEGPPLSLLVSYRAAGRSTALADSAEFRFVRATPALRSGSGAWWYRQDRGFAILVDDSVRASFTPVQYDTTVVGGMAIENVRFHLPRRIVEQLMGAHAAQFVLGSDSAYTMSAQDLADLRAMRAASLE